MAEPTTPNPTAPSSGAPEVDSEAQRGADAVRRALIEAAAQRLGETGPSNVSVRDVARRAGVNHGQVHHYFGGKRGLLVAAMRKLATDHFELTRERSGGSPIPPLFVLAEDPDYWRAICQVTMEGDLDLARLEVDEDISIPRSAMRELMQRYEIADDDLDYKAQFASLVAMQLGWVALEDFIMLVADVRDEDRDEVRARAKAMLEGWIARTLGRLQTETPPTSEETP